MSYTLTGTNGESGLAYDEDGNMITDGIWNYRYDAENRLREMEKKNNSQTLQFKYDYLGRRVLKTVRSGGPTSSITGSTKFVWSGWRLVAELDGGTDESGTSVAKTYLWGTDLSDANGASGGAGGLLAVTQGGTTYFTAYDVQGNLTGYLNSSSSGSVTAGYEYNPYGEIVSSSPSASFAFGFATQYTDWESGLIYYGLRYYSPKHGRFINRDPIEEAGGKNLYSFVGNNPANAWDVLGLCYGFGFGFGNDDWDIYFGWSCPWDDDDWWFGGGGGGGGPVLPDPNTPVPPAIRDRVRTMTRSGVFHGESLIPAASDRFAQQEYSAFGTAVITTGGRMILIGAATTQADSPVPGPADVAGVAIAAAGAVVVVGGVVIWAGEAIVEAGSEARDNVSGVPRSQSCTSQLPQSMCPVNGDLLVLTRTIPTFPTTVIRPRWPSAEPSSTSAPRPEPKPQPAPRMDPFPIPQAETNLVPCKWSGVKQDWGPRLGVLCKYSCDDGTEYWARPGPSGECRDSINKGD